MNGELLWVLTLLLIAIVLFTTNKIRMDVVALLVIVAFVLSDTLTLEQATAGFADPNVLLIAALFVIGDGLVRTGIAYQMGDWLVRVAGSSESKMLVFLMLTVAGLGAFMSSTRGGCYLHSSRSQCFCPDENFPKPSDDATWFCRANERHDDIGCNASEYGC